MEGRSRGGCMLQPAAYYHSTYYTHNLGPGWHSALCCSLNGVGGLSINDDHGLTSPFIHSVSPPSSQSTGLMV
jgi:hypothetical protein